MDDTNQPSEESSSWVFVTALFALASFVEALAFGHYGAFTPLYLQELGVPTAEIPQWTGYLAAATFAVGLPLAPLWGIWADKYGRKPIIVRSTFVMGLVFLVAALSTNVWHLLVARILVGFMFGNTGVMYAFVSSVAPKRQWSLAIASIGLGGTIGMSVGPLAGGFAVTQWGIRPLLAVDAALAFLVGFILIAALREKRVSAQISGSTGELLLALGRSVLGMRVVVLLFATYAALQLGAQISMPFVPILVERLYVGADLPTAIGMVGTGFAVGLALCTPLWGRLGDRKGHRPALLVASACLIPVLAVQAFAGDVTQLLIARTVQGMFQAAITPLALALVALHTPEERRASVLNLSLFPNYLSWILGPTLGAVLASVSLPSLFLVGALITLGALGVLWRTAPAGRGAGVMGDG